MPKSSVFFSTENARRHEIEIERKGELPEIRTLVK